MTKILWFFLNWKSMIFGYLINLINLIFHYLIELNITVHLDAPYKDIRNTWMLLQSRIGFHINQICTYLYPGAFTFLLILKYIFNFITHVRSTNLSVHLNLIRISMIKMNRWKLSNFVFFFSLPLKKIYNLCTKILILN